MKQVVLAILLILCLTACGDDAASDANNNGIDIADIPTAAPTPIPDSATNDLLDGEATSTRFELGIWLTNPISVYNDQAQDTLLAFQLSEFDTTHPDVRMSITHKTIADQGGMLNYLRTGRNVAPDALPDVVALPASQVATAASEGLILPLTDLVDPQGFYAAALELGTVDGTLYGVPFALNNVFHVAYNSNSVATGAPNRWRDLVALDDATMILSAAGPDGAAVVLQAYAEADNGFSNDDAFAFDEAALTSSFELLRDGVDDGLILREAAIFTSSAETWNLFRRGDANFAIVEASDYLREQTEGTSIRYAPLPGINAPMEPVVSGWVWAITTPDAARQAISAELIQWLTNAQNLGSWSLAARMLPAREAAFDQWENTPYINFLQNRLQAAHAMPHAIDSASNNALSNAVVSLINLPTTAEDAAAQMLEAIQP